MNNDAMNLREMINVDNPGVNFEEEWQGMPEFEQEDLTAWKSIVVHFATLEDMQNFSQFIDQVITEKTKSIWYPKKEKENLQTLVFHEQS